MILNSGEIVGESYKIVCRLKKGGFSQTYKAEDTTKPNKPLCVVKEIKPPLASNPSFLEDIKKRFKREAETLELLGTHPQIPKLYASWAEKGRFYLVQEYIEGHDLRKELVRGKKIAERETIELLKEILLVLQFVHQQKLIHRDVKPSNILRRKKDGKIFVIDFGAVKEINKLSERVTGDNSKTKVIGTENYMPPETQAGKPKYNSDIYAVGIIGIQALTGLHPKDFPTDPRTGEIIWRFATHEQLMAPVSLELETILNKMVRYHFKERYQSVEEVLEALSDLKPGAAKAARKANNEIVVYDRTPEEEEEKYSREEKQPEKDKNRFKNFLGFGLILGASVFSIAMVGAISLQGKTCNTKIADELSCGEEVLSERGNTPEKEEGVKAFARGKYKDAIDWFEKARVKDPSDPETLIYLNNAKLAANNFRTYTIAAVVPLGDRQDGGEEGREILQGVAQLQDEINQHNSDRRFGIRVIVANDDNSLQDSRSIAGKIARLPDILTVIGHYNSANTKAALPIYQRENIVLISPSDIINQPENSENYFFSIYPKSNFYADALSKYAFEKSNNDKVAVFYNPSSPYSNSLHDRFFHSFYEGAGQVEKQFDLSREDFNPETAMNRIAVTGASILVMFPEAKKYTSTYNNILRVIENNNNRYGILATSGLYDSDILKEGRLAENVVIAIPWHHLNSADREFVSRSKNLWEKSDISWRTAMGYDAALTSIVAFRELPTLNFFEWLEAKVNPKRRRTHLQQSLGRANFTAVGVTGTISFQPNGDRAEAFVTLVKVVPDKCSPYNYSFIPVDSEIDNTIQCDRQGE